MFSDHFCCVDTYTAVRSDHGVIMSTITLDVDAWVEKAKCYFILGRVDKSFVMVALNTGHAYHH